MHEKGKSRALVLQQQSMLISICGCISVADSSDWLQNLVKGPWPNHTATSPSNPGADYAAMDINQPLGAIPAPEAVCPPPFDPATEPTSDDNIPNTADVDSSANARYDDKSIRFADDIKVEYHPQSQRDPKLFRFEEFTRSHDRAGINPAAFDSDPWKPFKSRDDFEFAEICLEAGLTKDQITALLCTFEKVKAGTSQLSFKTYRDVEAAWELASHMHTQVSVQLR